MHQTLRGDDLAVRQTVVASAPARVFLGKPAKRQTRQPLDHDFAAHGNLVVVVLADQPVQRRDTMSYSNGGASRSTAQIGAIVDSYSRNSARLLAAAMFVCLEPQRLVIGDQGLQQCDRIDGLHEGRRIA
ncbi:MAG TPA: hypothetical protein VLF18_10470 [Tahibacter sp.]|uniref:hypothetical protein n=1 Tax=Tahibacter sp. TaxID=2056211 RepID=UPI002CB9A7E8|nr:hypothetical protein [Tahibacter sp.]HSX60612.1 hypothetical protein [Tahibacter sp.]